jgi:hypothetical protein
MTSAADKVCKACGVMKPLADYHRDKRGRHGVRDRCKACIKTYMTSYKAAQRQHRYSQAYQYPKPLPTRRAGARPLRVQNALLEEIQALRDLGHRATTERFLYYRLESRKIIEKGDSGEKVVSRTLTELREAMLVGMDEIVDRSRGVIDHRGEESVEDYIVSVLSGTAIRIDPWDGDPPVLVVESESLAGLLEPLAREYRIAIIPLGGQGSCGLLGGEVPQYVQDGTRALGLMDLDLSGGHIERSARERIEAYAGVTLQWERIAITAEQVEEHGLTWITKTDKRHDPPLVYEAVETEALDQRILIPLVRDRLDELLPVSLADVRGQEQRQRDDLLKRLRY